MDNVLSRDRDWTGEARAHGWCLVRRRFEGDRLDGLVCDLLRLSENPAEHPRCGFFYNTSESGERRLVRIERIWDDLPTLAEGFGKELCRDAEAYLGEEAALFKDKVNFRYPGSDGYAPHQDAAAGWGEFADRFVSLSPFLAASDTRRGGFEIAGSHHLNGRFPNENGRMTAEEFAVLQPVELRAYPGDMLVLDGETPHRTSSNGTGQVSMHVLFTFVPARFQDARATYYEKKFRSFEAGAQKNVYEFRVFRF